MIYRVRRSQSRFLPLAITTACVLVIGIYLYTRKPPYISPVPQAVERVDYPQPTAFPASSLADTVEDALSGVTGDYAIAIKNLRTQETFFFNSHKVYASGSLYKLWVMATVYEQMQQGSIQPDEQLHEDVATLNEKYNISSEAAELTDGTISFTLQEAIKQMITISHNYAALTLTKRVGVSTIDSFLKHHNLRESTILTQDGTPKTTAADMLRFFEKLYRGEVAPPYKDEMLTILKNQEKNDKLPKYLPAATVIAHKTGEIDYFTHDAGIVYAPHTEYIIVLLSESEYPPGAAERIALISQAVYNYFTKDSHHE